MVKDPDTIVSLIIVYLCVLKLCRLVREVLVMLTTAWVTDCLAYYTPGPSFSLTLGDVKHFNPPVPN